MSIVHKPSRLALSVGALSALIGTLLFVSLVGAAARLDGLADGPASAVLSGLSWAAFFLPAYFWFSAIVLFIPGFRPDLLFLLISSILPFCGLAVMARFLDDPAAWFRAWPASEYLGVSGVCALSGGFALFSSASILVLRARIFRPNGNNAEARKAPTAGYEETRRVLLLERGRSAEDSTVGDHARSMAGAVPVFRVPTLAPIELPDDRADSGTVDGRESPEAYVDEAGNAADSSVIAADQKATAEISRDELDEEPIPVMFGRNSDQGPALEDEAGTAFDDPAMDERYWSEDDAPLGDRAEASRPPLMPMLEVFQDGEHKDSVRTAEAGGSSVPVFADAALLASGSHIVKGGVHADSGPLPSRALSPHGGPSTRIGGKKKVLAYVLPTDGLLTQYPDGQYWVIDEKTRHAGDILMETLKEFNIEAEVTGIRKGPVITMFEILPAPGVRLAKIATLSDNIALRLAASSVRIVAPIPGKHAVGIEVPNDRRSIVSFREIVESEAFNASKMEVPVVLGKDVSGEVMVADLTQTPHLLIAGSTGSGKSVCVNSIILSILYKRSFNEVKLLLIDPKIVELKLYNGIPHLLTPVITEPKKAFQALQYCICEMERRYSLLDAMGVRDIRSYNRKIAEKAMATERIPYIVVIIDEFADLMATTGKELESTLARLAAMSRAVGIHLVLATQRPSVDVITGLIKANIPSRIAFMVASKFDSRIIIDMVGAEKLLGRGDMLYSSATDAFPVRMQGAFVSDDEVERVVAHVKTLGEPDYIDDEIFIEDEDEDDGPSLFDEDEDDPLFEKALEIVLAQGKASASFLQRKLKIGYNRAARIVELMEEKGIVGKAQGSKPRDLVRNPDFGGSRPPSPKARYVPDPDDDQSLGDGHDPSPEDA